MLINLRILSKLCSSFHYEFVHELILFQECLSGFVVVTSPSDVRHDGITLVMEGMVSLQLSNKNIGMFEAFRNNIKPITLVNCSLDLQTGGKIPSGVTEIPFEFPLTARQRSTIQHNNQTQVCLLETYHGVFVSITYSLKCTMKRSFLNKDLNATCQFVVQYKKVYFAHFFFFNRQIHQYFTQLQSKDKVEIKPVKCIITPETVQNAKTNLPRFTSDNSNSMPNFNIVAELESTVCSLDNPFTGQVSVIDCIFFIYK